ELESGLDHFVAAVAAEVVAVELLLDVLGRSIDAIEGQEDGERWAEPLVEVPELPHALAGRHVTVEAMHDAVGLIPRDRQQLMLGRGRAALEVRAAHDVASALNLASDGTGKPHPARLKSLSTSFPQTRI